MTDSQPAWKSLLGLSVSMKDRSVEEVAALAEECGVGYLEIVGQPD